MSELAQTAVTKLPSVRLLELYGEWVKVGQYLDEEGIG
jgi:hypothetical protein